MVIKEFIESLEKSNFSLVVENGKLILRGDKNKLTKDEILAIKSNKEVIDYINTNKDALIEYISVFSNGQSEKRSKDISSIYGLSGLQQGMLFHGLYDDRAGAYIEQLRCDLVNPDLEIFRQSWQWVLKRHSVLRSAFYYDEFKIPVQCVYRNVDVPLELQDFTNLGEHERTHAISRFEEEDRKRKFDFKSAPLMRVALLRISSDRYRMIWTSHHILLDGWSTQVVMEEFLNIYESIAAGKQPAGFEEDRFEDYIRFIERRDKEQSKQYWTNYLGVVEQNTLLPFIGSTTERTKGKGDYKKIALHIDAEKTARVERFAKDNHITINTVMQGVWAYLLHRYTGNDNLVYGVVVSGRPDALPGVERRVGMYINTLPLRATIEHAQSISKWLQSIQAEQFASRKYEHTPLHDIQRWIGSQGDLFDSLLVFENYPVSKMIAARKWALQVENVHISEQTNYPLTITVGSGEYINVGFSYNTSMIDEFYISRIMGHFENVLMNMIQNAGGTIGEVDLLAAHEKQQLLVDFNNTAVSYQQGQTIIDLFEVQVNKTPDAKSIIFEEQELTYQTLNEKGNQLAHYLRSTGIKEDTLVPICMERNIDMIVAMLGVLKAGGAYVPIDPQYPQERIKYMLEDTKASVVITSSHAKSKLPVNDDLEILEIDRLVSGISQQSVSNPGLAIRPDSLAYVIYTSGSTGHPKGVMIEHRNVYSFIRWSQDEFASSKFDIVYASTSICFDLSIFEIFYPLSVGKTIRVLDSGLQIPLYVHNDRNVLTNTVPVVMEHLIREGTDLRNVTVINMAGEPIPVAVQQALDIDRKEVRNLYGPTEDTTYSTVYRLKKNEPLLIGRPISNTQITILSRDRKLLPVGVPGEICISGDGLARGYLHRDDLTKEKFVENPFNPTHARLYRTGDLGRWLPDGNIEYMGRIDAQVKIRGYRIELGEIEAVLQQSDMITQAVVLARQDKQGHKRLVAYVVPDKSFTKEAIVQHLRNQLPDFMIPALWIELGALPLTPNGKIDRKALPDADASELLHNEYVAPRTELETKLVEIWKELLQVDRVGVRDNFFELGGHSLLVIRLISTIRRELKVEVAISTFFELVTIEQLANFINVNQQNFQPKLEEFDSFKL